MVLKTILSKIDLTRKQTVEYIVAFMLMASLAEKKHVIDKVNV